MNCDAAVVVNEAQFSKFVHEKTHPGRGSADHLRKRLLADFRDHSGKPGARLTAQFWESVVGLERHLDIVGRERMETGSHL
jgi:hypothetical protein